ncbi:hypothetical protein, partial [Faecalicatena contorta]|uniref:hypothetical protein n=1 Tax=Faecalicatena contorta TaxID=39482 RepID=UPI003216DD24
KRIGIFDAVVNQSAGKMPDTTPLKSGVGLGWGGWFDVYSLYIASVFQLMQQSNRRLLSFNLRKRQILLPKDSAF